MSDLAATNCGCASENGCSSIIWIILLLSCCGCGGGTSLFGGSNGCGNESCWIILLLLLCGNGGGCGCM